MNTFRSIVGAIVLMAGTSLAAEPPRLFDEGAAKLINLQLEGHQERIVIASIVEGTVKDGPFEAKHVRRVVAIHPVPENGKMVRRICTGGWRRTFAKPTPVGSMRKSWACAFMKSPLRSCIPKTFRMRVHPRRRSAGIWTDAVSGSI